MPDKRITIRATRYDPDKDEKPVMRDYDVALDPHGNLYITEDPGGSFATKHKGDDIWVARPGKGTHAPASSVERVASLTDCDAEPTGLYWELHGDRLFVNVQHRGGDRLDKAVAISQR